MSIVTFTARALSRLALMNKPEHMLKFSLKGGGCVGMKQELEYVHKDKLHQYDEIMKIDNIDIAIDKDSIIKFIGTEVDYVDTLISSGFTINNPNVEMSCGCGESITFKSIN